jgi:hypothetical protein
MTTLTPEQKQAKLKQLVTDLAGDLRETVAKIEAKLATTQNHYGDYMALLSSIARDKNTAKIISMALVEAGANVQGVTSAMRVSYGE